MIVVLLIYFGSRGLRDFDSALIGYAVATIVAAAALTYRYAVWIDRPPTRRYFNGGWRALFTRRGVRSLPKAIFSDLLAQTYIKPRSTFRWVAHLLVFWGVILSLALTLALSWGWIRFTLASADRLYRTWVFGIPVLTFPAESVLGFVLYHFLDFTAALVIAGTLMFLWRRLTDPGVMATQRFSFDLMPLSILLAISLTGLALTVSSMLLEGRFYWFLSLTHQAVVVFWLLGMAFGKFFHVIQRPATIGVKLYQNAEQGIEHYTEAPQTGRCARCNAELPSAQFATDLKATLQDLGQHYQLGNGNGVLQDYCPKCKRVLRGQAYYGLMGKKFL